MTLEPIRRSSLVEAVVTQLRASIDSGAWPVDTRIPIEAELAERFDVGRNTVREAVRVLVHAGVLDRRQGSGTFVRQADNAQNLVRSIERAGLRDRIEMRLLLETEAARLAAGRRTDADCERLCGALEKRAAYPGRSDMSGRDVETFVAVDAAFHDAVVAASHNAALIDMYRYFTVATRQIIRLTETEGDLPAPSQAAHECVYRAILAGDADAAEATTRTLLLPTLEATPQSN